MPGWVAAAAFPRSRLPGTGNFNDAIAPLRAACRLRAEDYQAPDLLALAYTGLGRRRAALRAYARAVVVAKQQLAVNPGDVRALYLGAGCLARLGRRKTALSGRRELSTWTARMPPCCTTSAASTRSWAGGPRP